MFLFAYIWCWIVMIYSRIVGHKHQDVESTRRYFAKVGIHFDEKDKTN